MESVVTFLQDVVPQVTFPFDSFSLVITAVVTHSQIPSYTVFQF